MDIPFTNEEYQKLLEVVELGEWMLLSPHSGTPPELAKHREIIQKTYAFAEDHACDENVIYDDKEKAFITLDHVRMATLVHKAVRRYDESAFEKELIGNLAWRDIADEFSKGEWEALTPEEQADEIDKARQVYTDELKKHGFKRLYISEI